MNRRAIAGRHRFIEGRGWRLDRRAGLLRNVFHAIGAAAASCHASVSDYSFPFVKTDPVTGPVDAVSDPV
jgi:hypothetical protein